MYDNALTFEPVHSSQIADVLAWRREVIEDVFGPQNEIAMNSLLAENERYYDEAIADGSHLAVFTLVDGVRVGCGSLCFYDELPSPDNPTGRCAYVMNVYVRPEYRRRGIGKLIVIWLVDQARLRGITKIYLESTVAAKPMYRSIGFVDMPDYMVYRGASAAPAAGSMMDAYPAAAPAAPPPGFEPAPAGGYQPMQTPAAYGGTPTLGGPSAYGAQPAPNPQPTYGVPEGYGAAPMSAPEKTAVMPPVSAASSAPQAPRAYEGASTLISAPDASAVRPLSSCAVASFLLGLIAALSSAIPFISLEEFAETLTTMHPIVDIVTLVFGGVAIVLGIVGLVLIARKRLRGRALAIIGLIIGVAACAIVITLMVMAAVGGPRFDFDVSDFYQLT